MVDCLIEKFYFLFLGKVSYIFGFNFPKSIIILIAFTMYQSLFSVCYMHISIYKNLMR